MDLSRNLTDIFEDEFIRDKKKVLAQRAVHKNGIQASCESIEAKQFRNKRDIWTINTVSFRGNHYAAFPPKLAEICMIAGCPKDGIILDPFIGSGTVGFVALMQDRKYIGIELNEEYCKLARKRISEEVEKIDKEKEYEVCKE